MKTLKIWSKIILIFLLLTGSISAQSYYPSSVSEFNQALTNLGNPVLSIRSDPSKAIGVPQNVDIESSNINFVSLGFGGSIVLKFSAKVPIDPTSVIRLFETTYGYQCNTYPEIANIFASNDGISYTYIGQTCGNNNTILNPYGLIDTIQFIRIVDVSPAIVFSGFMDADGYDVDGVEILSTGALPIVLGEFRMEYLNELISIFIRTMSESNSKSFHIESSIDLIRFMKMIEIPSYGNSSSERTYEKSVHFEPQADVTYFRLSEEDMNGRIENHQIIAVRTPKKSMDIVFQYDLLGRRVSNQGDVFIKIMMKP
jgi:hypothetical protein